MFVRSLPSTFFYYSSSQIESSRLSFKEVMKKKSKFDFLISFQVESNSPVWQQLNVNYNNYSYSKSSKILFTVNTVM